MVDDPQVRACGFFLEVKAVIESGSFFKAYDMRGVFGEDFDLETIERTGRAIPRVLGAKRVLVGRDARLTSPEIRDRLVKGLCDAGADVVDIGLATTPMVYFFTAEDGFDASVQITASHNPANCNGLKISRKGALPVGMPSGLGDIKKAVISGACEPCGSAGRGNVVEKSVLARYIKWLKDRAGDFSNLRFAVDCSNGMASLLARELFGAGALYLNDTPDGTFPAHSPNPLAEEARVQISEAVVKNNLDLGVIFDGDADRVMFVDGNGKFIQPDYLIALIAGEVAPDAGERIVVHDVRTSRGTIECLREAGFKTVMGPVGHAYAKALLRSENAFFGGELAGHYYFRDFHFCDSGELAALNVLRAASRAKKEGRSFADLVSPVSSRYANSGEMNFTVQDKDAAIARVLETARSLAHETARSEIDGYRLEYDDGWISVRKSNTEPYLRLIAETRDGKMLEEWKAALIGAVNGR